MLELHTEHLKMLRENDVLGTCGPFKDNDGDMQIIKANSLDEAKEYVLADPFVKQKYYRKFIIHELIEASESNNNLMDDSQTL